MTTTSVTAIESTYQIGTRHVHYRGDASTLTSGALWKDGGLLFWVFRDGVKHHQAFMVPNFAWLYEEAAGEDEVWAQAIGDDGSAGSFYSHASTVAAFSTAANIQYVSHSGNDANAGTSSGTQVATLSQARTNLKASWSTGGTNVIFIERSATSYSTSTLWDGHTAAGRVAFVAYGSGDDPEIVFSSASSVPGSGQNAIVIVDCVLTMGAYRLLIDDGITRSVPYDFVALRTSMTSTSSGVIEASGDTARTSTDRDAWVYSFFACVDTTVDKTGGSAGNSIYGLSYSSGVLLRNYTSLGTSPTGSHHIRVLNASDWYCENCWFESGYDGTNIRLMTMEGDGVDSATRRVTMVDVTLVTGALTAHEGAENEVWYVNDITVVGGSNSMMILTRGGGGFPSGSSFDCSRILHRNVSMTDSYTMSPLASVGGIHSIAWIDCAFGFTTGGGTAINIWGAAASYDDGSLTIKGCVAYWDQSGDPQPRVLIDMNTMTMATVEPKFAECDYNHCVRFNSGATFWMWDGGSVTTRTLAVWQGASAFDDNSSVALSTTLSWTTVPASGPIDPTLTAGGSYLDGIGWPRTFGVDMLGHVRNASTPYAGPHEYDSSTYPDEPDLGGDTPVRPTFQNLDRGSCATRTASLGGLLL